MRDLKSHATIQKNNEDMNVGLYSFARTDLNKEILYYQKEVFRKFNLNLTQIVADCDEYGHGEILNKIIQDSTNDYIVIFDIDCIPLKSSFYNILLRQIKDGNTLSGAKGCALHIDKHTAYIHPCFFGFKRSLYYDCNSPNLMSDKNADTGQNFTHQCRKLGKPLKFWDVTQSNDITWESPSLDLKFGHGTTFEHMIYHQYQIRLTEQQIPFINKCKQVLNVS